MAKKRALVDATLTVTAASDIFTQDIEEMVEVLPGAKAAAEKKEPVKAPQKKTDVKNPNEPATEAQVKAIQSILGKMGIKDDFAKHEKASRLAGIPEPEVITSMTALTKGQASKIIESLMAEAA